MPTNYFNKLEDHIDEVLSKLDSMIPKANSEIMDAVTELFYSLDKSSTGSIQASVKNLKKIDAFKSKISNILENGEYGKAVEDYLGAYTSSSGYLNDYFGTIVNSFKSNDELYQAILESNVSTTSETLLGSGIDANFTDPIVKILKDNVTSGSNKAQFMQSLKDNISGDNGKLVRYTNQVASDSITQFNSNYINTISNDLGLKHFYYKGTKIKTTRPFCDHIAGKYFTEKTLHKYFDQQQSLNGGKGWNGMIKGENWSNFPIYRGGYGCRHYLIPVSQELYDAAPDSAKY